MSRLSFSGRRFAALLGKELRGTFGQPLLYIVGAIFLILSGYYFYSDLGFFVEWAFGENILRNFFELLFVDLRKVLMFTVPLLTMRLLAEERKLGTIELLLTYPLSDLEIVAAKLCACFLATLALLVATTPNLMHLHQVQAFPIGPVLVGYLGLALLALCFVAIGLFFSSLTDNQVVASMSTFGTLLLLWILTWNETGLGEEALTWLRRISMFDHFDGFAVGVVKGTDLVYFASLVALAVTATLVVLGARTWHRRQMVPTWVGFAGLLTAMVFTGALASRWNFTIDFTPEQRHGLSSHARRLLEQVAEPVEVIAFVRSGHPANRETSALFERLSAASPLLRTRVLDLHRHPALAKELGIDTFGAVVVTTERGRRILGSAREDFVVGAIRELTRKPPIIGIVAPARPEGRADPRRLDRFAQGLEVAGNQVRTVSLDERVPRDIDVLVVGAPDVSWTPERIAHLDRWLRAGGRVLAFADPLGDEQLRGWLARLGIAPRGDVVLDPDNRIAAGEAVSFGAVAADPEATDTPGMISATLDRPVIVSFATSLETAGDALALLRTGPRSWATEDFSRAVQGFIGPDRERDRIGERVIAAAREWQPGKGGRSARLVVIGDSDLASDAFLDFLSNRDFVENALLWLLGEEDLIGLRPRQKEVGQKQLFVSARQAWVALLLGVVLLPGASAATAGFFLLRRRFAR